MPKEIFHGSHSLLFSTELGMHFQELTLALILDSTAAITTLSSSTALTNTAFSLSQIYTEKQQKQFYAAQ